MATVKKPPHVTKSITKTPFVSETPAFSASKTRPAAPRIIMQEPAKAQTIPTRKKIEQGRAFQRAGNFKEALKIFRQILAHQPDQPDALHLTGLIYMDRGNLQKALGFLSRSIELRPQSAQFQNNIGLAYKGLGQHKKAAAHFQKALEIKPDSPDALNNMGFLLTDQMQLDTALPYLEKAIEIKPDFAEAHSNLGNVYQASGKLRHAEECYLKAVSINPKFSRAWYNLGCVHSKQGNVKKAISHYRKTLDLKPDFIKAHCNLAYSEQYRTGVTLEKMRYHHGLWDKRHALPLLPNSLKFANPRNPDKKLRIGAISPNFGRHPVGYLTLGVFENLNKDDIELYCYSDRKPDEMTARFKTVSKNWIDIQGQSNKAIAERIRSDQVDILITLAGHSANNRLLVMAQKPAPVQVSWIGYPGDTGLSAIDYFISDIYHTPQQNSRQEERLYGGKALRLEKSYIAYDPPEYAPAVGQLPHTENGFITFGCFNNSIKLNPPTIKTWASIMNQIPESRLFLKYQHMDCQSNKSRLVRLFSEQGVTEDRLTFEGKSPHDQLLGCYNKVDIAFDTFPYSGGLTTCEALWMGVPVITIAAKDPAIQAFAGRHSYSHLANAGLSELVAQDQKNYSVKAVALAGDIQRLSAMRDNLRRKLETSPLMNGPAVAQDFTRQMRKIWQNWCAKP